MRVFAVIDTNVIVSALLSRHADAATVRVLDAVILSKDIVPLYNEEILQEYSNVLRRDKFGLDEDKVEKIIRELTLSGFALERVHSYEDFPDPKDVVFYEVALSKEGSFLVTGNKKHFPDSTIVVSPSEILEILGK